MALFERGLYKDKGIGSMRVFQLDISGGMSHIHEKPLFLQMLNSGPPVE